METQTKKQQKRRLLVRRPKIEGFTLIELLVVIAIIALLASVVIVSVSVARAKSRDAKRLADLNQLVKGLELYFNDAKSYPTTSVDVNFSVINSIGQPGLVPDYMNKLPKAPTPADGTCGTGTGNGVNDYFMYKNVTPGQLTTNTYVITFCLGAKTGTLGPGSHTLTQGAFQ